MTHKATVDSCPRRHLRHLAQLSSSFGLSAAERDVLAALLRGKRPIEIAAEREVAISTVRSQLKRLFAKTGCRGQADLIRRVLQSL